MSTRSSFKPQHEISVRVRSERPRETTAPPSIPHPNREQALKRARLTAGFPNIVKRPKSRLFQSDQDLRPCDWRRTCKRH